MDSQDMLYVVFEKHLLQSPTAETVEVTIEEFASLVVVDYLTQLSRQGVLVPQKMRSILEDDLMEDVIEMARKKTYGHHSIQEYRIKNADAIESYQKRSA